MRRCPLMLAVMVGCATGAQRELPPVRFANAPPVQAVDDRRDVAVTPAAKPFMRYLFHVDGSVRKPLLRLLELPGERRARGVNAIDEVPDSTWFTNRIGVRDISLDELRAAPGGVGSPEAHRPWTIESTKVGGTSVGFIITDARGERWILKFDLRQFPEMETAAHVIVGKLLWAAGYNVTEDHVVYFRRGDLVLGPKAVVKDKFGDKRPLDAAALDRKLAHVDVSADGQIRGLASRMLSGKPLGGHPGEGVRKGDPNDLIPHELRRDLRGVYTLFAWLDHEDIQEGNYLDMYVEDPADPARRYVKHYFIDFGKSLGVMGTISGNPRRGSEYYIDVPGIVGSLLSFGTMERRWEHRASPAIRGVGSFDAATFDPAAWKPTTPAYTPLVTADRFDKYWGAKLVMRFSREQLRVAVEAGRFSDPRAVDYLVDTLVARQRLVGRYWFSQVNPLDGFTLAANELCFDDLALAYGLATPVAPTRYVVTSHDVAGTPLAQARTIAAGPTGYTCATVALARERDGYTIVEIATRRPGFSGTTYVHLARAPRSREPRVIGVWRP